MQIRFGLEVAESQGGEPFFKRCTVAAAARNRSLTLDQFSRSSRAATRVSASIERCRKAHRDWSQKLFACVTHFHQRVSVWGGQGEKSPGASKR